MQGSALVTIDWGTTNRRIFVLDSDGVPVCREADGLGVTAVAAGEFPAEMARLRARFGDVPFLLAGMIGSNRGWIEAPYLPCPVTLDGLRQKLLWVEPGRTAIVPGACVAEGDRVDIMRGEEVQLLGAIVAGLIDPVGLACHPGTHNKWATLHNGKISSFQTVMTGELFSLLKEHSILSDLLQGPVEVNDAFKGAADYAINNEALPASLFSIRARVLLGQAKKEDTASYASGLLIGADVRIGLTIPTGAQINVIGRSDLTHLYAAAVRQAGREARELDGEQCFLAGIREIAKRIK